MWQLRSLLCLCVGLSTPSSDFVSASENLPIKRLPGGGARAYGQVSANAGNTDGDSVFIEAIEEVATALGAVATLNSRYANANCVLEAQIPITVNDTSLVPTCNASAGLQNVASHPSTATTTETAWQESAASAGGMFEIMPGTNSAVDATLFGEISIICVPLLVNPGATQTDFSAKIGSTQINGLFMGQGAGWNVYGTLSLPDGTSGSLSAVFGDDVNTTIDCGQLVEVGDSIQMHCGAGGYIIAAANGFHSESTNWWSESIAVWFHVLQD